MPKVPLFKHTFCNPSSAQPGEIYVVAVRLGGKSGLVLIFLRKNGNHSHEISEVIATLVFAYAMIIPTILLPFLVSCGGHPLLLPP